MLDRALRDKLALGMRKNAPELRAYLTGRMPAFVSRSDADWTAEEAPVFVFHEVAPDPFEAHLRHLTRNGYVTLDSDGIEAALDGKGQRGSIVLSFDDATSTFWTYAFPLLRKYGCRAILFAIPGLVPEDAAAYPNLDDLWAGRCSRDDLARRSRVQPLCTWRELTLMHQSGIVDIQSHSLTHSCMPVSRQIVDFLHPGFDTYFYGNVAVPISSQDDPQRPARALRLGAPVFASASRLSGRPRFVDNPEVVQSVVEHVAQQGGPAFFQKPGWRAALRAQYRRWPAEALGSFESAEDMAAAIRCEMVMPKRMLEERLGKQIRHFCYPWFQGCDLADRIAAESGYRGLFCGLDTRDRALPAPPDTTRIHRISEDYLFRLPGDGRRSIWSVGRRRTQRFVGRLTAARS